MTAPVPVQEFAYSMLWACEWTEGLEEDAKAYSLGCEEAIGHMLDCWLTQSGYTPQGCETSVAADYIPWNNLPTTQEGWVEVLCSIATTATNNEAQAREEV